MRWRGEGVDEMMCVCVRVLGCVVLCAGVC